MKEEKLSLTGGSLLWFGAAISIAEIMTGALIAPLGLFKGILAIVIGHIIGGTLFYFFGLIGAEKNKSAMESTEISFGRRGSIFFSIFNILQLIGWTAVMIISGAEAMAYVLGSESSVIWCILIGITIILWVYIGLKNIAKVSAFAVGLLFLLSVILGFIIFSKNVPLNLSVEGISFGLALELAIAMPLSWLPLVSDYTKNTTKPKSLTFVSAFSYFLGSCFMYIIGLGASIYFGTSNVIEILVSTGLGVIAMFIVIFSTVTTTYLDVYSAGESFVNIFKKFNAKVVCYIVTIVGIGISIFVPIVQYENFLYLIGSVFVPMASIMIADYFINKNTEYSKNQSRINIMLWLVGFITYRIFLNIDTILGSTIPVVIIMIIISAVVGIFRREK